MSKNHRGDLTKLATRVGSLSDALASLGRTDELRQLLVIIRRPGWTTPAEFRFAIGLTDAMLLHVKALAQSKNALIAGSRAVRSPRAE